MFLPTSVHTKETTRQVLSQDIVSGLSSSQDIATKFSASWTYRQRRLRKCFDLARIDEQVFGNSDVVYDTNYLARFRRCRTWAWIVRDIENKKLTICSNSCRLRWCPMCGEARVKTIAHSCREFFKKQKRVRFLTLTLKHRDISLKEQIARIKKSFAKLCRSSVWRKYVTGSIWFLQTKPNCGGKWWHVHLHILLTGSYVPQDWLSEKWMKITGDSKIVDIREVRGGYDLGKVIKDVVRYAGQPANLLDVDYEYRLELVHVTDKIRICGTTGICKAMSLRPKKFKDVSSSYTKVGS